MFVCKVGDGIVCGQRIFYRGIEVPRRNVDMLGKCPNLKKKDYARLLKHVNLALHNDRIVGYLCFLDFLESFLSFVLCGKVAYTAAPVW